MKERGWEVHPETSGFDLLLVCTKSRSTKTKKGDTVGVQAKARPTVEVLAQAMPLWWSTSGPDFFATLVPHPSTAFLRVAERLQVNVFYKHKKKGTWHMPTLHRQEFWQKVWVPDVVVDVPAGVPSPRSVTRWKIAAVRLCMRAEKRGYVTLLDFEELGLKIEGWRRNEWVTRTHEREAATRNYKYVLGTASDLPHKQYPEIVAALLKKEQETK